MYGRERNNEAYADFGGDRSQIHCWNILVHGRKAGVLLKGTEVDL